MADTKPDAVALLKADHRKVGRLFEPFEAAKVLIAEIEAGGPGAEFYDAKVKVLSDMIEHHVEEQENRVEGVLSQTRKAGLDRRDKMAVEKEQLVATYKSSGLPKPETPSLSGAMLA